MRRLFGYIVAIFFLFCWVSAEGLSASIFVNQKSYPLRAVQINNVQYVEMSFIISVIFPSATIRNNTVTDKNFEIRFASSSFFVFLKKEENSGIFQMNLPVISINNLLYIPIDPFLRILATNQLIKYDKLSAGYFIEHFSNINEQTLPALDNIHESNFPSRREAREKPNTKPANPFPEKGIKNPNKIPIPQNELILEPAYKQKKEDGKYHIPEEIKKSIIR